MIFGLASQTIPKLILSPISITGILSASIGTRESDMVSAELGKCMSTKCQRYVVL